MTEVVFNYTRTHAWPRDALPEERGGRLEFEMEDLPQLRADSPVFVMEWLLHHPFFRNNVEQDLPLGSSVHYALSPRATLNSPRRY